MIFTTVKRIVRNAFTNFWRKGLVSVATVLVMVLAIFMVGSLILFFVLLESTLAEIESKVDVTVYFKLDAEEDDISHLKGLLERLPEVETVAFVSREEALLQFQESHRENTLISSALEELGDNPLGASLRVQAQRAENYETIARFLEEGSFSSIDKVNFRQNQRVFERLTAILAVSRRVGIGVALVLALIAFLVVFNTIRLAIYTSREEIGVMRLVGASSTYVRGPFLVEGMIHGFFAALLTTVLFWPLTLWLGPKARDFFGGIDLFAYYVSNIGQFFFVLMLTGVMLGVISSFIATRKYLKI